VNCVDIDHPQNSGTIDREIARVRQQLKPRLVQQEDGCVQRRRKSNPSHIGNE
jgi:hypothetical protein